VRSKDWRSTVMLVCVTIIGMTNFLVPIFNPSYKTDPLVTYAFIGLASSIVGYKGVSSVFAQMINKDTKREDES